MSWGFDFNNVDEYGYPCEGWVKFDELEPIRYLVNGDYASQWGYTKSSSTVSSDADTGKSGSFDKGADNYFNTAAKKLEYQ